MMLRMIPTTNPAAGKMKIGQLRLQAPLATMEDQRSGHLIPPLDQPSRSWVSAPHRANKHGLRNPNEEALSNVPN
jgi:hypothetical protein